jgi:hypothetical protein
MNPQRLVLSLGALLYLASLSLALVAYALTLAAICYR